MLYTNISSHIIGDLCYHIGYFVRWGGGNVGGGGVLSGGVIVGGECWGEEMSGKEISGGKCSGGTMSGGKCPEGKYPGGNIRGGGEMSEGGGNIREGGKCPREYVRGGDTKNTCISSLHLTLDIIQLLIPMLKDLYYNSITSITKKYNILPVFSKIFT